MKFRPRSLVLTALVLLATFSPASGAPSFLLDPASPSINAGLTPADILSSGPFVQISGAQLGLQTDVAAGQFDVINAFSFGSGIVTTPPNRGDILFSVDRVSVGLPGTAVNQLAGGGNAAQNVYLSNPGSGMNSVFVNGGDLGLKPGAFGDDLRGLDFKPPSTPNTYFSLSSFSASVSSSVHPSDILVSTGNGQFGVFENGMQAIGLNPNDEISALVLDVTKGVALFSLSPFSPSTFTTSGAAYQPGVQGALSPADILYTDFDGHFSLWASAPDIGLLPQDDLDALATVGSVPDNDSTALLLGSAMLGIALYRSRKLRVFAPFGARVLLGFILIPGIAFVVQGQPGANLDLETVFLGYCPIRSGSSAQIDFRLQDQELRFTAWVEEEPNRFTDFHIDLGVAQVQNWHRLTSPGSDRLIFTYADRTRNIQLNGNFLLAPYWHGVLDTAPLDLRLPMDNVPFGGPIRWLLARAPLLSDSSVPGGKRAMPFGVFNSIATAVSIPTSVLANTGVHIFLDDGFDATSDEADVTSQFIPVGSEAVASSLPFRPGSNRLRFIFPDGEFESFSLNYDDETPAIVEEQVHLDGARWFDEIDEAGNANRVVKNCFNLVVGEEMPETITSSYLRIYRMRPVGYAPIIGLYNVYLHGLDLSGDRDADGMTDLRDYVLSSAASHDPRAGFLHEDFQLEYDAVAERVQPSIAVAGGGNYVAATRGWGLPAAPASPNGLGWAGEHFWMDTFLGQRLVSDWFRTLRPDLGQNFPVVGVCDSGFNKEGAFPNPDMPVTSFWDLWSNVGTGAGGQPVLINNQNAAQMGFERRNPVANDFQDNKIWDLITGGGHGTGVAQFVDASGARQKMGTGINNYVSVIKLVGLDDAGGLDRINVFSWSAYAAAASTAERVPQIRVLNFSNGMGVQHVNAALIAERTQDAELLFDRLSRSGIAACVSSRNNTRFFFPLPAVIPAGGLLVPVPGQVAPVRGNRAATTDTYLIRQGAVAGAADNFSPLVMRCGGLVLPNAAGAAETAWGPLPPGFGPGGGQGGNVSVAAHGSQIHSVQPNGSVDFSVSGTSFSTPMVSGLLGEIIRILDLRNGDAAPTTQAQRAARAARVRQAIEIVEATSDHVLGANRAANFDAPEPAPDNQMGFGRLNGWKAVLTAINGGLAAGGISPRVAPLTFGTLVGEIDAAHTLYYGFQFRLQSAVVALAQLYDGAKVWLNNNPYDDDFGSNATLATNLSDTANTTFTGVSGAASPWPIVAFKRTTSLNSRLPTGFNPVGVPPVGVGVIELSFSAAAQELRPPNGVNYKRLELRRNGQNATDQPFFALPIDLARLRNNNAAAPPHNGTNIRFDDFVFEVLVDHTVAFNPKEVRGIAAAAGALAAADEVELTATLSDASGAGVNGVTVNFIVSNTTTGAADGGTQISLRTARGAGVPARTQDVATAGGGIARVFVTRVAQAPGVQGVVSRILLRVNTVSAGGAAVGAEMPQEFTIPVRP